MPGGSWKGVPHAIRGFSEPPSLIVISRLADNRLWAEALNLGVYDVLAKPLVPGEVACVLTSAWIQELNRRIHASQRAYNEAVADPRAL